MLGTNYLLPVVEIAAEGAEIVVFSRDGVEAREYAKAGDAAIVRERDDDGALFSKDGDADIAAEALFNRGSIAECRTEAEVVAAQTGEWPDIGEGGPGIAEDHGARFSLQGVGGDAEVPGVVLCFLRRKVNGQWGMPHDAFPTFCGDEYLGFFSDLAIDHQFCHKIAGVIVDGRVFVAVRVYLFAPADIPVLLDHDILWVEGCGVVIEDDGIGEVVRGAAAIESEYRGGPGAVDKACAEQGEEGREGQRADDEGGQEAPLSSLKCRLRQWIGYRGGRRHALVLLLEVAPAGKACESCEGVKGRRRRRVVVFDFSPDTFEGGDAEADGGLLEDAFAEVFEILVGPGSGFAPGECGLDEAFALFQRGLDGHMV